jgi:hypothetical protein
MGQMDAVYQQQVADFERGRMLLKAQKKLGKAEITQEELERTIADYQLRYQHWLRAVAGKPMFSGLGSARICPPIISQCIDAIAKRAVPRNVGVAHGEWWQGTMGALKRSWLEEKLDYAPGWAFTTGVPLIGQEIGKMDSEEKNECPEWYLRLKNDETSPPHASFLARTTSIVGGPLTVGCIYGPPGKGTHEELHRKGLDGQMRKRNLTMFTSRPEGTVPLDYILDHRTQSGRWMWDPLLFQAANQVQEGTVCLNEFEEQVVLRVGPEEPLNEMWRDTPIAVRYFPSPDELGDYILNTAWERYDKFRRALAKRITNGNGNGAGHNNGNSENTAQP